MYQTQGVLFAPFFKCYYTGEGLLGASNGCTQKRPRIVTLESVLDSTGETLFLFFVLLEVTKHALIRGQH